MEKNPARRSGTTADAPIQVLVHDVLASLPENLVCNCVQVQIRGPDGISRACHRPNCCLTLYHLEEGRNNKVKSLCRDTRLPFAEVATTAHDANLRQQHSVPALNAAPTSSLDLRPVPRTLPQATTTYQLLDSQVIYPSYGSVPTAAHVSPPLYVYRDPLAISGANRRQTTTATATTTLSEPATAAHHEVPGVAWMPRQDPVPVQMQPLQQTHTAHQLVFHTGPALSPCPSGPTQAHSLTEYSQSARPSTPLQSYPGSMSWSISQSTRREQVLQDMKVDSDGLLYVPSNGRPVHRAATPSPQPTIWLQQQHQPRQREQLHHSEHHHSEETHPQEQQQQLPQQLHPSPRSHYATDSNLVHGTLHTSICQTDSQISINMSQVAGPSACPQEVIYRRNSPQNQSQLNACIDPSVYHNATQRQGGMETISSVAVTHPQTKSAILSAYLGSLHCPHSDFHPSPQQPASGAFGEGRRAMCHVAAAEGYPHEYHTMTTETAPARNTIKMEDEIDDSRTGVLLFVAPHLADSNRYYGNITDVNMHQGDYGCEDNDTKRHRSNTVENDQGALLGQLPHCLDQYPHQSDLREESSLVGDGNTRHAVQRKSSRMSVLEDEVTKPN